VPTATRSARARATQNIGYLLLGEVITVASAQPFETYVASAVLQPTGMSRTGFSYGPDSPVATGYVRAPRAADPVLRRVLPAGVVGDRHGSQVSLNPFYVDGPAYGGLIGDVLDAARFVQLHLNDGTLDSQQVLRRDTARAMRELQFPGKPFRHGLGWFQKPTHDPAAAAYVEHFGAGAGFWNAIRLYPGLRIGMVVMANTTAPYDINALFDTARSITW
jgi:CubicO group peptidase (beta-lactamase class C family)